MSSIFKSKVKVEQKAEEAPTVFTPDGERLSDGSVRYKLLCDGGIDPSGVFWSKTLAAGASTAEYLAAQAERDEQLKRLRVLSGAV